MVVDDSAPLGRGGRDGNGHLGQVVRPGHITQQEERVRDDGAIPDEAEAVQAADTARVPHYHVALSGSKLNVAPPSWR